MEHTVYQIVYKSSYHGEVYSDPRAVSLPLDVASCPASEVMEILKTEMPGSKCPQASNFAGLCFSDFTSAVAVMKTL